MNHYNVRIKLSSLLIIKLNTLTFVGDTMPFVAPAMDHCRPIPSMMHTSFECN